MAGSDPKANTCSDHEHVRAAKSAAMDALAPGGWLDKYKAAQAAGGGTLLAFIQQLLSTLGPIIGPIILAFIQGLVPHVPPAPAPAGK